jgi:hypothetical protein
MLKFKFFKIKRLEQKLIIIKHKYLSFCFNLKKKIKKIKNLSKDIKLVLKINKININLIQILIYFISK